MSGLANWVDGVIEILSPSWAVARKLERLVLLESEKLSAYRDSIQRRIDRQITSRGTSADFELELGFERRSIVDRARQLEKENLLAGSLLDRSVESVVGEDGYRLQALTDDPRWNAENEELWKDWCENDADSRGMASLAELMGLGYRSKLRDGDFSLVLLDDGSVRATESDEIASPEGGYMRRDMVDGVELDERGRPRAFWVYAPTSKAVTADRRIASEHTRVPASDVIFMPRRLRTSATRGLSAFAGYFWPLEQLDGIVESVAVSARMAACFGLVITKKEGAGALSRLEQTTDGAGENTRKLKLEPGKFITLRPGEAVDQVKPEHVTADLHQFLRLLVRFAGSRFACPLEVSLGDFSEANLSTLRVGMKLAQRAHKREQGAVARVYTTLRQWKTINWIEEGLLAPRPDALKHGWVKPGEDWIEPVVDVQSSMAAVEANMDTLTSVLAQRGKDIDEVIRTRELEVKKIKKAGLAEVRSTLSRDPVVAKPGDEMPGSRPGKVKNRLRALVMPIVAPTAVAERNGNGNGHSHDTPAVSTPTETHLHIHTKNEFKPGAIQLDAPISMPPVVLPPINVDARTNVEKGAIQSVVGVDVDAEIKGGDKTVTYKRDADGEVEGYEVKTTDADD